MNKIYVIPEMYRDLALTKIQFNVLNTADFFRWMTMRASSENFPHIVMCRDDLISLFCEEKVKVTVINSAPGYLPVIVNTPALEYISFMSYDEFNDEIANGEEGTAAQETESVDSTGSAVNE